MSEANKAAAAIMAAEASRQKRALLAAGSPAAAAQGYDIAGEIWAFFETFMARLEQRDGQSRP